ncbi:MAG TPA: pilin [Patescibacteria group bacterium]|nr:pilin [Patescibacteria group bacterium]
MQKNNSLTSQTLARIAATGVLIASMAFPLVSRASSALENLSAAANTTATESGISVSTETDDLPTLIGRFIGAALGLLGVILVVLIIYAGFLWMTAQGNEEKVKKAKAMITNAVIGMIIIFAAYAITNFVISSLRTSLEGS